MKTNNSPRVSSRHLKKIKKPMSGWIIGLIDVLLIGVCLCVFALFHHVLPQAYIPDVSANPGQVDLLDPGYEDPQDLGHEEPQDPADWAYSFPEQFTTGEPVITDNRYVSRNVDVTVTQVQENGITYYIQDIYIRNIQSFLTAFAKDTYGKSINEWALDMAIRNNAVCAINGDYYGIGTMGVVIRNGTLYRDKADGEVLVLYQDGTMEVFSKESFEGTVAMAAGAWQAWCFGPSLLDQDGQAIEKFNSNIARSNPRTAVGYYEPGHYCFVTVDGRQPGYSDGITFSGLSRIFANLGCKVAFNMDGGQTSVMTFMDAVANQPYKGGRKTSDIIFIRDL